MSRMNTNDRILLVEDDPRLAEMLTEYLSQSGYRVTHAPNGRTAIGHIAAGEADAVSWGKLFIANPDLPRRLQVGAALNEPVPATFYGGDTRGYTDYPSLAA